MEKLLTLIVPCYNSAEYLNRCVDSLLAGGDRVQIILVDDGSTDETGRMLDDYQAKYLNLDLEVVHQENAGHGGAINNGLRLAKGKYVKIVDSDDWLDQGAYKEVLDYLENNPEVDLFLANYVYDKPALNRQRVIKFPHLPVGRTFSWDEVKLRMGQYFMLHSVIYNRKVLERAKVTLPTKVSYDDNIFVFEPMVQVQTMRYLPVNLYHYFIGRDDQSVNEKVMLKKIDQQILINKQLIVFYASQVNKRAPYARYMKYFLEAVTGVTSVILIRGKKKEYIAKKDELWQFLKTYDLETYKSFKRRLVGHFVSRDVLPMRQMVSGAYLILQRLYSFN